MQKELYGVPVQKEWGEGSMSDLGLVKVYLESLARFTICYRGVTGGRGERRWESPARSF